MKNVPLPKVSIIIPVYNAEEFLRPALESVLAQDYTNTEVIAVDDGSTDDSLLVLNSFGDARLRVVVEQSNRGQSAAANVGIEHATGDYIKFFDADDIMNRTHISAQVSALSGHRTCIASCRWAYFSDDPTQAEFAQETTHQDYQNPMDWIVDSLTKDRGMMGGCMWLIPRPILDAAGGWDERLSLNNDFDFSIRVLLASSGVCFAAEAKLFYRKGLPGALTQTRDREAMDSAFLTTRLGIESILAYEDSPRTRRIGADRFQEWLFSFYPAHPDLVSRAELHVSRLGGSARELQGGTVLKFLRRFLTWKQVRWLQHYSRRLGWQWILKHKRVNMRIAGRVSHRTRAG